MLKRIQELRNVGRFQNCRAGGVEFGRLTIIYGRNAYGKSTVGDIFASISTDDPSLITGRATIPADNVPQRVYLSVQIPNTAAESEVRFEGDAWTHKLPPGLGVKVFDDGFLHNNLFAARAVTRSTKENFSAYILGERGVQKAQEIAEKKRARQQLTRDRNTLERDAFGGIDDVSAFVSLAPKGTKEEADAKLQALRYEHAALIIQRKNVDDIQARSEGRLLDWPDDFSRSIGIVNETLPMGLEGTHEAAKARVTKHITERFLEPQGAERWIRQGLNQNKGDACQFCGQVLSDEAKALLDAYRQAFDAEFDRHEQTVKSRLGGALAALSLARSDATRAILGQNAAALATYPELFKRSEFDEARGRVVAAAAELDAALGQWDQVSGATLEAVRAACERKLQSPHTPLPSVDAQEAIALEAALLGKVGSYRDSFSKCVGQIQSFKQSSKPDVIQTRLAEVSAAEREAATNLARINLGEQCTRHKDMTAEMARLDGEIPALENALRDDQSDYLRRFFDSLNRWFNKFGSRDFTLERAEVIRGHTPVYFLRVKYRGVDIDERDLVRVFSESDRRALALAVFWTHLQEIPDWEKAQQIVVLDDPLTSFDDGRVTVVHRELVGALDSVRQVIVLSHYSHEIRSLLEKYGDIEGLQLLCLETRPDGTHLVAAAPEDFIRSEHDKARENLTAFADGTVNICEYGTLRVFFEQELSYRFAAQIAMHNIGRLQFSARIDELADNNVISDDTRIECHDWRRILNPAHHTWPTNDLEDQRRTTRSLLEFIYNNLVPK